MKTSIVITTFNRPSMLRSCLDTLAGYAGLIHEVVVSDDGSDTNAAQEMERLGEESPLTVKLVFQQDRGYRLAAARNKGIRNTSGDYIVSIDCDIILLPGALEAHLRHAQKGVFLAGNRAFVGKAGTQEILEGRRDHDFLEKIWAASERGHLAKAHRQFVRNAFLRKFGLAKRHKPKLLGCHFSLFKNDIEKINGFDENYEGWGLEDDDFAARLHMAGVKGKSLITEARALHLWHEHVLSRPDGVSGSPNYEYFKRKKMEMRCEKGIDEQD